MGAVVVAVAMIAIVIPYQATGNPGEVVSTPAAQRAEEVLNFSRGDLTDRQKAEIMERRLQMLHRMDEIDRAARAAAKDRGGPEGMGDTAEPVSPPSYESIIDVELPVDNSPKTPNY